MLPLWFTSCVLPYLRPHYHCIYEFISYEYAPTLYAHIAIWHYLLNFFSSVHFSNNFMLLSYAESVILDLKACDGHLAFSPLSGRSCINHKMRNPVIYIERCNCSENFNLWRFSDNTWKACVDFPQYSCWRSNVERVISILAQKRWRGALGFSMLYSLLWSHYPWDIMLQMRLPQPGQCLFPDLST